MYDFSDVHFNVELFAAILQGCVNRDTDQGHGQSPTVLVRVVVERPSTKTWCVNFGEDDSHEGGQGVSRVREG